jgi:hypothetical protein
MPIKVWILVVETGVKPIRRVLRVMSRIRYLRRLVPLPLLGLRRVRVRVQHPPADGGQYRWIKSKNG